MLFYDYCKFKRAYLKLPLAHDYNNLAHLYFQSVIPTEMKDLTVQVKQTCATLAEFSVLTFLRVQIEWQWGC